MARFITVKVSDLNEVLVLVQNAAQVITIGNDAYNWVKKQLVHKQIAHNDQNATHHSELPHQGGYVSFYWNESESWMYIRH